MNNKTISNIQTMEQLRSVAAAYKIKDANKYRFQIIAYERAADAVEHLSSEAKDLWDEGKLEDVAGIGKSIAEHLGELFKTGKSKHFDELMQGVPPATFELIKVPGIGPKTAYTLSTKFNSKFKKGKDPFAVVKQLAKAGEIAKLDGFGEESQKSIVEGVNEIAGKETRLLYPYAKRIADELSEWMRKCKEVEQIETLGSLRRKATTVGDIDMAAASDNAKAVSDHFCKYPKKNRVLEKGERTASIIVPGDRQVDLMVETPEAFGALLQHFTGSKHHNIKLRKLALKKGLSVSDYGIKPLKGKIQDSRIKNQVWDKKKKIYKFATEEAFYNFLGMEWIPPEMREDTGEIELALQGKLPNLVELVDVKADLHMHSDFDIETSHDVGQSSVNQLIKKASDLGYEYIALTEHNPSQSGHSDKKITNILKKKREMVDTVNANLKGIRKVFNSLEIDILPDGSLPVSSDGLSTLDFALVSIHSSFKKSKKEMTKRVLSALSQPRVQIFAHPTARKLNEREGVELDWDAIFDFCLKNNKWIEINADAMRLDLPDFLVREAVKLGIKLTFGTDAHHADMMDNMENGLNVARRGWATKNDIVNTRTLVDFEKMLQ